MSNMTEPQHTRPLWLGFVLASLIPPITLYLCLSLPYLLPDSGAGEMQITVGSMISSFFSIMMIGAPISFITLLLCAPIICVVLNKHQLSYAAALIFGAFFGALVGVLFTAVTDMLLGLPPVLICIVMGLTTAFGFCRLIGVKRWGVSGR